MNRREFTKLLGMARLSDTAPLPLGIAAAAEPYSGPF